MVVSTQKGATIHPLRRRPVNVPRCMSTQHPDNVQIPFFADHPVIQGETEIKEAYYAYSHLGCTEQMWDYEGKEVDHFVVKKLLSRYEQFFRKRRLGTDLFLTLRVPNPRVERAEAKVLLETLESIPRSYDAARLFYGDGAPPPIFEVILPMTTDARELNRVYHYYREFVGGKERQRCFDVSVGDWVGDFRPDRVNVIPLIEDREHLLRADRIVAEYLQGKEIEYQRVFLARSDPALNYGLVSAVLLAKVALARLGRQEKRLGVDILPILGVGSAPFRGNFVPARVGETLAEYPSVQTFTIQSAFKYDHEEEQVRAAIQHINRSARGEPQEVEEERCIEIIARVSARYAECVRALAPLVNGVARYVPPRRARKLHIGLFGYSRRLDGHDTHLPRAIKFCAAMYSLGIPPEILGFSALDSSDLAFVRTTYRKLERDMADALRYLNEDNLPYLPPLIRREVKQVREWFPCEPNEEHREATGRIMRALQGGVEESSTLTEGIAKAASVRQFLG
ncbi:TPA: phosphoenolpyruvate carboxylase [Candidatus Bipolaricaulota bacterium]|nr:phosphoenolpyruvate carboxylase [Candidatus Bipolaricaulota bacterium]